MIINDTLNTFVFIYMAWYTHCRAIQTENEPEAHGHHGVATGRDLLETSELLNGFSYLVTRSAQFISGL